MIAQIVVFSRKTDAQRKKNFAVRSAKIAHKFCEWKPYKEDIVVFNSDNYLYIVSDTEIASHFRNAKFTL